MFALDLDILHGVQTLITPWLTPIMRLASWLLTPEIVIPAGGLALAILFMKHKRLQDLVLLLILSGNALTLLVKPLFHRLRPTDLQAVILDHQGSYSLPSGHAVAAMTIGGALILLAHHRQRPSRWLVVWASLGILLVGFSRVYLGAHWPSDVLAGYLIGWLWLVFVWRIVRPRLMRRWPSLNQSKV